MTQQIESRANPARWIRLAVAVGGMNAAMGLWSLGCNEDTGSFPPGTLPYNNVGRDSGTGGGGDSGPPVDLCGCAVMFPDDSCISCAKKVVDTGGACATKEQACIADFDCIADAQCVGDCNSAGGAMQITCLNTCFAKAGQMYLSYLACVCTRCSECTSEETCADP